MKFKLEELLKPKKKQVTKTQYKVVINTTDKVLDAISLSNLPVTAEEISEKLEVTKGAVFSAIFNLKKRGYGITTTYLSGIAQYEIS
ncbi:MAG: hypothetical protein GY782_03655 [Gammaproteobacteria bacterium]|nr:hypothetical protein [Gammaproteobacteria bacterium]